MSGPVTVFYDGSCPLCRREIGLYQGSDGAEGIRFCDVSNNAAVLPGNLSRSDAMARFHVTDQNGYTKSGARAFIALWLALPRWRWIGRLASIPPLPFLLEGAYRSFLLVRPAVQKLVRRYER
jgi:predicted DCC family thiol-disulfide oxidoreductase YuxK